MLLMTGTRTLAIGAALLLFAHAAQGRDRTRDREYRLGNDVTTMGD
jgi:hypothetical protein